MATEPLIRPVRCEDVPTLLKLMRATAAEQGHGSAVTATAPEVIQALGLGGDDPRTPTSTTPSAIPHAKTVVLVAPEGEIAGMAAYFTMYVAWQARVGLILEDLYVVPKYRRRKYARLLVQHVAREARRLGCTRVDWSCYRDNARALKFYKGLGAEEQEMTTTLRLDGDALRALAGEGE